jgi:cytochrome c biogenesis protein CcmG/thiol:disulfide interchange protein DsbE
MATADDTEEEIQERGLGSRLATLVPILVLLGLLAYGTLLVADTRRPATETVPEFELPLLGGGTISNEDLEGTPVVVNFWASWCTPCREEAPMLEELWQEHKHHVLFLGVNTKDNELGAKDFVEQFGITYPIALDPNEELVGELDVFGLPQTFFIDHEGRFIGSPTTEGIGEEGDTVVLGAITEKTLREKIAELMERAGLE